MVYFGTKKVSVFTGIDRFIPTVKLESESGC